MNHEEMLFSPQAADALQARFGLRVAGRLNESAHALPHDMNERLKAARELAIDRARLARQQKAALAHDVVRAGSSAALRLSGGGTGPSWWLKLASVLPLAALVAGILLIEHAHIQAQIDAAADIDVVLLADDAPPAAYSDPGFVEFLKSPRD